MMVTDPVCGREMETEDAAAASDYDGEVYYFCSEECKEVFEADPETFLYPPREP